MIPHRPIWPLLLPLLFYVACTKEPIPPDVVRAKTQLAAYNKQLAEFEEKIKTAAFDPGLKHELVESRELLKSRIERIKYIYNLKDSDIAAGGEGGGEGGGGHEGGGGGEGHH